MSQELTLTRRSSVTNGQERQVRVVHEIACGKCSFKTKSPKALLSHRCNNVAPKGDRRNVRKTQQRI